MLRFQFCMKIIITKNKIQAIFMINKHSIHVIFKKVVLYKLIEAYIYTNTIKFRIHLRIV